MSKYVDKILVYSMVLMHLIIVFIPCFIIAAFYLILHIAFKKLNLIKTSEVLLNIAISWDQLANAFTGGDSDETVSSRSGKLQDKKKWACFLCSLLNIFDTGHCKKSIEIDEGDDSII